MRIKDDVAARIGLCTLTQAVRCTITSSTTVRAVTRRRVPADRGNCRRSRGGGAGANSGGCALTSTHGLAIDGQVWVGAIRTSTLACFKGFTRVQPARAGAQVGIAGGEYDKVAGRVGVAVVPAEGLTVTGDSKLWARFLVAAETGDEGRCAAWCCSGGRSRCH